MAPLFVVQEIPGCNISEKIKICKEKTGRKSIKGTQKLLSVMEGENILLYTPLIKWYLKNALRPTAVHQLVEYEPEAIFMVFVGGRKCQA